MRYKTNNHYICDITWRSGEIGKHAGLSASDNAKTNPVGSSARVSSSLIFATIYMKIEIMRDNNYLSKELKFAIRKELRKECRQEAIKILQLGDDKDRKDFLKYHKEDNGNICCLVLDFAKKKLVKAGKMKQEPNDCFNDPFRYFEDEDDKEIG